MTPPVQPAGLILAAGASRRMGRPKALLDFHGETFLDRMIRMFAAVCDPVIVVLGHRPEVILAGSARAGDAVIAVNHACRLGQLSSLQCGLRSIPEHSEAFLFSPVDYAHVAESTVRALAAASGPPIVFPRCQGRKGHPVCCGRPLAAEFLALPVEAEARLVTRRHLVDACFVDVDDPGILSDIDDPESYRRLLESAGAAP